MFTVIFADKETIKLFEETKMFFKPLVNPEKVAFCEWVTDAEDFDTMVPGIYDLIEHQDEWRALILFNDGFEKLNPFDFTEYSESFYSKKESAWDSLKDRRERRIAAYEKAISNPLLKLTTALCGIPNFNSVVSYEEYSLIMEGQLKTYEYMLKKQFEVLNCPETASRLDKYQRDELKRFVAEENIDVLIACVRLADVSGIMQLIPNTEILEFIKYIGNDPIYYDPEYTECLIENTRKNKLLKEIADNFSMRDKLPTEVLCLSQRTFAFEKVKHDIKWKKKDETSSSRFSNYNLYSEKLKYILFDVISRDNKQYKFDQIKFLCFLLVVANNDIPKGLINANNVYCAKIDFNVGIVTKICENYISKLKSTQFLLKDIEKQLDSERETSVDNRTAQRLFESDIQIPVKISGETDESELHVEYKGIGLATDCPGDESSYWSAQYREINKRFIRYLREPRRAVKSAVSEDLRSNNLIDDDRSLLLSENQVEDVKFHLAEVEQKIVEAKTTRLFDTKQFADQIQKADKEVKRGISQRMTKKKTWFVGLTAVLAYFIGFLPLLLSSLNTTKSFVFSLALTGIMLGLFLIVGFIFLFTLRRRLVNRFKHFNYVMSGICNHINSALGQFSHYISCVCNLMRDFSVLKKRDSAVTRTKRILAYHDLQITEQVKRIYEMFAKYVDFSRIHIKQCDPYDYDFTVLREYEYEMPCVQMKQRIEYLQPGNEITVPVDYVESIKLVREELYD